MVATVVDPGRISQALKFSCKLDARELALPFLGAAYRVQHELVRWPLIALNRLLFGVMLGAEPAVRTRAELERLVRAVRARYRQLQRLDLENVRRGVYPASLLFNAPLREYMRVLPRFARDTLRVAGRARAGRFDDLPVHEGDQLPAYYRRCFHWQTDGYLSQHSAQLYDLGVEILFTGMADVMRRQVLTEVSALPRTAAVLDVACGTGSLLAQLRRAMPAAQLTGLDLSEAYVEHARSRWAEAGIAFRKGNAERLPYPDASFDAVVNVFLLHELPRGVRRSVVSEMLRVLKPGGVLVIEDAAQLTDSPDLEALLRQFPRDFHEPFFAQYIDDPIETIVEACGGVPFSTRQVFVAKLVSAHKASSG